MPAVTGSVPGRTEKDVQPRVEKCHGLTNVPHPNPGLRDGEDNTRSVEDSASPAACQETSLVKPAPAWLVPVRKGEDIPVFRGGFMLEETTTAWLLSKAGR